MTKVSTCTYPTAWWPEQLHKL